MRSHHYLCFPVTVTYADRIFSKVLVNDDVGNKAYFPPHGVLTVKFDRVYEQCRRLNDL